MKLPFEVLAKYSSDTLKVAVFKSQNYGEREPTISVSREVRGRTEGRFFPSEEKALEVFDQFVRWDKAKQKQTRVKRVKLIRKGGKKP